jgi:hypothetical protein
VISTNFANFFLAPRCFYVFLFSVSFVETWQALVERGNAGLVDYATKLDNTLTEIAA